jgi:hypothetical protein
MQLIQALRDAISAARGPRVHRPQMLIEEYPAQMTMQEYYASLPSPWDIPVPEYGPIKELHKVRFTDQEKFTGDRLQYAAWTRRFFAIVHTKRTIVSEKAEALSTVLDTK